MSYNTGVILLVYIRITHSKQCCNLYFFHCCLSKHVCIIYLKPPAGSVGRTNSV